MKPKWVRGFNEWLNDVPIHPRYYPVDGNKERMLNDETEVMDVDDSVKSVVKTEVVDNKTLSTMRMILIMRTMRMRTVTLRIWMAM